MWACDLTDLGCEVVTEADRTWTIEGRRPTHILRSFDFMYEIPEEVIHQPSPPPRPPPAGRA